MAKPTVKLFDAYYDTALDVEALIVLSGTKSKVVCLDTSSFQKVFFEGKNFDYDMGRLSAGTIQKVTFTDPDGAPLQMLSGLRIDPGQLAGIDMSEFTLSLAVRLAASGLKYIGTNQEDTFTASNGNDILNGRGSDDELQGGEGRDVLIGGGGNDTFIFAAGMGRDTINDFDADGGGAAPDFIQATFASADISQSGKNTIVDFGNGDIFVLLKVNAADVTSADFV
ncbi:hypothetical protein IHQ71_01560 [Rhizobium sp. TH2]|uniref:calcium-binding protein n=1 Tax=Rhizobium sp. TH2 TaxID=2775403 RepID=UPI0021576412|nr:hypothetical protein [Rhizobium sp. TH2]UVC09344.1 hypothetical protein IHQ71_01560 [Rhizobium sp. TH2]